MYSVPELLQQVVTPRPPGTTVTRHSSPCKPLQLNCAATALLCSTQELKAERKHKFFSCAIDRMNNKFKKITLFMDRESYSDYIFASFYTEQRKCVEESIQKVYLIS